jgi:GTPase SAR1 family protein
MAFINLRAREIQIKIVYYGPAHSGKTANLRRIYALYRNSLQSRLLTVTAGDERTIFLDFMTFTVPRINGFDLKVRIYTVPGHEPCAEIRKTVLKGADGIVFVADLSAMRKTNIMSLIDLRSNLRSLGKDLARIPLVFQLNKCDLGERGTLLLPAATLLSDLNGEYRRPYFVASAARGKNVVSTLKKIITTTMDAVEKRYHEVT